MECQLGYIQTMLWFNSIDAVARLRNGTKLVPRLNDIQWPVIDQRTKICGLKIDIKHTLDDFECEANMIAVRGHFLSC